MSVDMWLLLAGSSKFVLKMGEGARPSPITVTDKMVRPQGEKFLASFLKCFYFNLLLKIYICIYVCMYQMKSNKFS